MTENQRIEAAWAYHGGTKHSYQSVRRSGHSLDFSNQPLPFKIYTTLPPIPLPRDESPLTMPALEAIAAPTASGGGSDPPDLAALTRVLFLGAGITRERRGPGWEVQYRAAACTGALYHIEVYLVCGDLPGLPAGVYHYGVHDFALRRLRAGDYRAVLVHATGRQPDVVAAPAVLVLTSTYWRNAWKYQARAYRHAFWDSGTILANSLAAAVAQGLPARVVLGFVDGSVNDLLSVDPEHEASLALVPLGRGTAPAGDAAPAVEPLRLETEPLSRFEVEYPAIAAMHAASSIVSEEGAAVWRGAGPSGDPLAPLDRPTPLKPLEGDEFSRDSLTEVILRRGSTRTFAHTPISFAQLSTILDRATQGVPTDFLEPLGASLNTLYLIVHAVDDLAPGSYVYHRRERALELLRQGNFRKQAGYLGLEQELPADASVNVYCLARLDPILARFGNRGYRAAQIEGGILGGKLYLGTYAQRLGATGLTFYDDDVTEFFSPNAAGKSVMFLAAIGHPKKRA